LSWSTNLDTRLTHIHYIYAQEDLLNILFDSFDFPIALQHVMDLCNEQETHFIIYKNNISFLLQVQRSKLHL